MDDLIDTIAKHYSITPEGMSISPDQSSRGPRGACKILKAEFTRLLGCTVARANANLKLRCKHYIRERRSIIVEY